MPDMGRSFIKLFGNGAVQELTAEVNRRLFAENMNPSTAVGEVLYGRTSENGKVGMDVTGSYWVEPTQEFGDLDTLCFKSSDEIPEKIENHLVWFYSKIDPNVVLCNKYDSDRGDFVGVRFKLVHKSKIRTFMCHKWVSEAVVSKIDPEDDTDQITWEDFWDIQSDFYQQARAEMVAEFPHVNSYVDKR